MTRELLNRGFTNVREVGGGDGDMLPIFSQILWVAKADNVEEDGQFAKPFHSVSAALAAAVALSPTASNVILIRVLPGIYTSSTTLTIPEWVHVHGEDMDSTILDSSSGYLVDMPYSNSSLRCVTLRNTAGERLISITGGTSPSVQDCVLDGGTGLSVYADISGGSSPTFRRCLFIKTDATRRIVFSDVNTGGVTSMVDCDVIGGSIICQAGGSLYLERCALFEAGVVFFSDGDLDVIHCSALLETTSHNEIIYVRQDWGSYTNIEASHLEASGLNVNAVTMYASPTDFERGYLRMVGNTVLSDSGSDVYFYAGDYVYWEVVEFAGNAFLNGIVAEDEYTYIIMPASQQVLIGGDRDCFEPTILSIRVVMQSTQVPTHVMLLTNIVTSGTVYIVPGAWGTVLEGVGKGVTTGGIQIVQYGSTQIFEFWSETDTTLRNLHLLSLNAKLLRMNSTYGGQCKLENCRLSGELQLYYGDWTTWLILDNCDLRNTNTTVNEAGIRISWPQVYLEIKHSRVMALPCIKWDDIPFGTNSNVRISYSVIHHLSGGANNPFQRTDVSEFPNYRSHHSAYNVDPETGAIFTNLIAVGQRYETIDANSWYYA